MKKTFNIANNDSYDGYQGALASVVYQFKKKKRNEK